MNRGTVKRSSRARGGLPLQRRNVSTGCEMLASGKATGIGTSMARHGMENGSTQKRAKDHNYKHNTMTREITQRTIETLHEAKDVFKELYQKPELEDMPYNFEGWAMYIQDLIQDIEMKLWEQEFNLINNGKPFNKKH